jgi:hypothetical protein
MDEISKNVCDQCWRDADGGTPHTVDAAGCGHAVTTTSSQACYCDQCAFQRGVCAICGHSMAISPPDAEETPPDKPHNGSRSVVAIIILSAVVMLAIAIGLGLHQC